MLRNAVASLHLSLERGESKQAMTLPYKTLFTQGCHRAETAKSRAAHLDKEVDKTVVKVLSAQMGVSSSGLDLKDALFDGQQGHIKCATAKVKDEDIALAD